MNFNIISVSGGKDSTALLLLALEENIPNLKAVFADTGNEHKLTYEYIDYLNKHVHPITVVKADFSKQLKHKSDFIQKHWPKHGISLYTIDRAVEALKPTGIPFLDLCLWKGRFPSSLAAFCKGSLKKDVIEQRVFSPLLDAGHDVLSWQGVRADESKRRAALLETEFKKEVNGAELWIYRPLLQWTAQDCFDMHKKHGIEPNPLYKMGMSRVGCMPCMQCRQSELIEISRRFPKEVKRIKRWEQRVAKASRRGGATFFPAKSIDSNTTKYPTIDIVISNIENKKPETFQYGIFSSLCSSVYGLCE